MRIEGKLTKWNDDRGFGFIAPSQGGPEVFVHISAFPNDGRRPAVGERLTFEVESDAAGKKRAKNLLCPGRPAVRARAPTSRSRRGEGPGFLSRLVPLVLVVAVAAYGYNEYTRRKSHAPAVSAPAVDDAPAAFRCDGRTHCSQMTSCAEATFFLRNCPGVKMDGNNDGIPCEKQWCTGPFAK
jgi:cold shock CspA family protein